jgi:DnaJ-class molecular chaperone
MVESLLGSDILMPKVRGGKNEDEIIKAAVDEMPTPLEKDGIMPNLENERDGDQIVKGVVDEVPTSKNVGMENMEYEALAAGAKPKDKE